MKNFIVMLLVSILCGVGLSDTWHWTGAVSRDFTDPNNWAEGTVPTEGGDIVNVTGALAIYDWIDTKFGDVVISNPNEVQPIPSLVLNGNARFKANSITIGGPTNVVGGGGVLGVYANSLLETDYFHMTLYGIFSVRAGGVCQLGLMEMDDTNNLSAVFSGGIFYCNEIIDPRNKIIFQYPDVGSFYLRYAGGGSFYNPFDFNQNGKVNLTDFYTFSLNWLEGVDTVASMSLETVESSSSDLDMSAVYWRDGAQVADPMPSEVVEINASDSNGIIEVESLPTLKVAPTLSISETTINEGVVLTESSNVVEPVVESVAEPNEAEQRASIITLMEELQKMLNDLSTE